MNKCKNCGKDIIQGNYCRAPVCANAKDAARRANHKDKVAATKKAWYDSNKSDIAARRKAQRATLSAQRQAESKAKHAAYAADIAARKAARLAQEAEAAVLLERKCLDTLACVLSPGEFMPRIGMIGALAVHFPAGADVPPQKVVQFSRMAAIKYMDTLMKKQVLMGRGDAMGWHADYAAQTVPTGATLGAK